MTRSEKLIGGGFLAAFLIIVIYSAYRITYVSGVAEGRRQITAECAAEIKRVDQASHPTEIRDWLKGKGK